MITDHSGFTDEEVVWGFRLWWPERQGNSVIRDIIKNYILTLRKRRK